MSFLQLHLAPDHLKPNHRWPAGTYLCRAIGTPENGLPFTRLVVFKGNERTEKITNIEFVSIKQGEKGASTVCVKAPEGTIPLKSEVGEDGIVCIMQENTPRCEECGLNLVRRLDTRKQEPYMVCPANKWGINKCKNADRHDMNLRRESEEERKQRIEEQKANPYGLTKWGEKYGLDFKSYEDYLQSDLWIQKRNMALSALGDQCQICKSKKGITVHHVSYDRIGKELIEDLSALCKSCHKMVHALVSEDPKQYNIKDCHTKIINMTVGEFFALKQRMETVPEWGLGYVDLNETDRETAEIVTAPWARFPATHLQNNLLKKLGYDGPSLNKQEAFFKIKELKGEEFKVPKEKKPQTSPAVEFEDPYFIEDQAERLWLNSTSSSHISRSQ